MGFQTPQYKLADYLQWARSGKIQLPDFQRGYKWEEERIRQLLVTVLRGHPMGVVMLLKTGGEQVRFKPRPIEGAGVANGVEPESLLLDGQQRLTSLTQALTGTGVVSTTDARGKLLDRCYYVNMSKALDGDEAIDDAVVPVPGDRVVRTNFGRDVVLDLSDDDKERKEGYFPLRLLYDPFGAATWLTSLTNLDLMRHFMAKVITPAGSYDIPAIELDKATSKSAVATVFEKVNTGGLPLNVFELLTAMFAGDAKHYKLTGQDFRLNDDWQDTKKQWQGNAVLDSVESTQFLQAVTMLATRERNLADTSDRPPAISAKREDILKLSLADYLKWRDQLRAAFTWCAAFLADRHIFKARDVPYANQLVPLAAIKVVLGHHANLIGVSERLIRWYWCGVLGELYGSATETRFARDIEAVPEWARDAGAPIPRTVQDATFVESRLLSLRTRNAAAYKGIAALLLARGARDWMMDKELGQVQHAELEVDIHHVFPQKWCNEHGIDDERRESIVNKTAIGASTNRSIGGDAPSIYLPRIEHHAERTSQQMDEILAGHLVPATRLRDDDFDGYFSDRLEALRTLIGEAMGKPVQRDLSAGIAAEDSTQFDPAVTLEVIGGET